MAKKASKSLENGVLAVTFGNGSVVSVDMANLSQDMLRRLAEHGLSQKVGDSFAGTETIEEAVECAQKVASDLLAGNWSSRVASGGPKATQLAAALAAATGKSIEEATAVLDAMEDEDVANLRKHSVVKAELAKIKAAAAIKAAEKAAEAAGGSAPLVL